MATNDLARAVCESKKWYADWPAALAIARKVGRAHHFPYHPYRCNICHRIHIARSLPDHELRRFKQRRKDLSEHEHDDQIVIGMNRSKL